MSSVNANINVIVNTAQATSQIRALQAQINSLNKTMAASGSASLAGLQGAYNKSLMDGAVASGRFSAKTVPMSHSIENFSKSLDKGKLSLGQYSRGVASQMPGLRRVFTREFDMMTRVAESRVKRLQTQYTAMGNAQKAMALTPTGLPANAASSMAVAAQKSMMFNKMIADGSTKLLNFGKNTQWAGRQLMVGFTLPLVAFGAVAAKTFMDLDKQARDFKRVYGDAFTPPSEIKANLEAIQNLGEEYTKYGIKVKDTMEVAATAAAAGMKNDQLITGTEETLRLSTIGQIDYQQALTTTISLQNAFKISNEELGPTIDYLGAVANQTVLTVDDMTKAIPRAAPVIAGLGGDVKDLAAMLVAMREGGVSAEQGANALKSGLASLINPTKRANEITESFGISIKGIVQGNKGDILGTVKAFGMALQGLDQFSRQQVLEKVFGKYQYARIGALFDNINQKVGQTKTALDLAGKSSEELGSLSKKSLSEIEQSTTAKFQGAVERLKISIAPMGGAFLKALTPIIGFVQKIVEKFNSMPDGVKEFITKIAAFAGIVAPVVLMLVGLFGNLIANAIKGVQSLRRLGSWIKGDASAFRFLAGEELDAAAAARSLEGATDKLTAGLVLQEQAIQTLIRLYGNLANSAQAASSSIGIASSVASVVPAMRVAATAKTVPVPAAGPKSFFSPFGIRKFATGVTGVPGQGNKDTIPALLTPGESIITKGATKKYAPIIAAMNDGTIQGFAEGTPKNANGGGGLTPPTNTSFLHGTDNIPLSEKQKAAIKKESKNELVTGKGRKIQYGLSNFGVLGPSVFNEDRMSKGTPKEVAKLFTGKESLVNHTMTPIYQELAKRTGLKGGAAAAMQDPKIRATVQHIAKEWGGSLNAMKGKVMSEAAFYAAAANAVKSVPDKGMRAHLEAMRSEATTIRTVDEQGRNPNRSPITPALARGPAFKYDNPQTSYRGTYSQAKFPSPVPISHFLSDSRMKELAISDQKAYEAGANSVKTAASDPAMRSRSQRNSPHAQMPIDGRDDQKAYNDARMTQAQKDAARLRQALNSGLQGKMLPRQSTPYVAPLGGPMKLSPALASMQAKLGLAGLSDADKSNLYGPLASSSGTTRYPSAAAAPSITGMPSQIKLYNARRFVKGSGKAARGLGGAVSAAATMANNMVAPYDKSGAPAAAISSIGSQIAAPYKAALAASKQRRAEQKVQKAAEKVVAKEARKVAKEGRTGPRFSNPLSGLSNPFAKAPAAPYTGGSGLAPQSLQRPSRLEQMRARVGNRDQYVRDAKNRLFDTKNAIRNYRVNRDSQRDAARRAAAGTQQFANSRGLPQAGGAGAGQVIQGTVISSSFVGSQLEKYIAPLTLKQKLIAAFKSLGTSVRTGVENLLGQIKSLPSKISAAAANLGTQMKNLPSQMAAQVSKMKNTLSNLPSQIMAGTKDKINSLRNFRENRAAQPLAIEGPKSRALVPYGQQLGGIGAEFKRIAGIIKYNGPMLKQAFATAKADTVAALKTGVAAIGTSLKQAGSGIAQAGKAAASMAGTAARGIGAGTVATARGLGKVGSGVKNWWQTPNAQGMTRGGRAAQAGNSAAMGLMGLSMALSMTEGKVGEFAQKLMPVTMGLMGLQMMIPMLTNPMGILILATAAVAGAFIKARMDIDQVARDAAKKGSNIGGVANRMETATEATGYKFSSERSKDSLFRISDEQKKSIAGYASYFEGENGKAFMTDLKTSSSEERYQKVSSIISQAFADGMPEDKAKEYGMAIAYYANDAMLKTRLMKDFQNGKMQSGTKALVDILKSRMQALDDSGLYAKGQNGKPNLKMQETGQSGASRFLADKTGIGKYDAGTSTVAEGIGKAGAGALLGGAGFTAAGIGLGAAGILGGTAVGSGVVAAGATGTAVGIAGAATLGSVVPVVGTIVGLLVAGGFAFKQYRDQVDKLNSNIGSAAQVWGGSIQVLKEAKNAEAALVEARSKGSIAEQDYVAQMADVRKVQEQAGNSFKGVVDAYMTGNGMLDEGAMNQALVDQLVLTGFDGDLAKSVVGTVNFKEIAKAMFPGIEPDQIANDPQFVRQKEVIEQVMIETLAGITPENAQQRVADVKNQWAAIANKLLDAAKEGLTSVETQAALAGEAAAQSLKAILTDSLPTDSKEAKALGMSPEQQAQNVQDNKSTAKVKKDDQGNVIRDQATGRPVYETKDGIDFINKGAKSLEERLGDIGFTNDSKDWSNARIDQGLAFADIFGRKDKNSYGDDKFNAADAGSVKNLAGKMKVSPEELIAQALADSPLRAKAFTAGEWDQGLMTIFPDLTPAAMEEKKQAIQSLAASSKDVTVLGTSFDIAAKGWSKFISDGVESDKFGQMGIDAEKVNQAMGQVAASNPVLAASIVDSKAKMDSFAESVAALADPKYSAIDIGVVVEYQEATGLTAPEVKAEIDSMFAYALTKQKEFKTKFGKKDAALIGSVLTPDKSATEYMKIVSKTKDSLKDLSSTSDEYKKKKKELNKLESMGATGFYDQSANMANEWLDATKGSLAKNGDIKIGAELVTTLFGDQVDQEAATAVLNSTFGGKTLSASYLPILAMLAMGNPEAFAALGAGNALYGDPAFAKWAADPKNAKGGTYYTSSPYGQMPHNVSSADVGASQMKSQLTAMAAADKSGKGGAKPPKVDPKTGGGGGKKEKTLTEKMQEEAGALIRTYAAVKKILKKGSADFKGAMAGPFAPEFIQYLKDQGEEGIALLEEKGAKFNAAYRSFVLKQMEVAKGLKQNLGMGLVNKAASVKGKNRSKQEFAKAGYGVNEANEYLDSIDPAVFAIAERATQKRDRISQRMFAGRNFDQLTARQQKKVNKNKKMTQTDKDALNVLNPNGANVERAQRLGFENAQSQITDDKLPIKNLKELQKLKVPGMTAEIAEKLNDMGVSAQTSTGRISSLVGQLAELIQMEKQAEWDAMTSLEKADEILSAQEGVLSARKALAEYNVVEPLQKEIDKMQEVLDKDQKLADAKARQIEMRERALEPIDREMALLEEQKTKISEVYGVRLKALDQVQRVNDRIRQQQQSQLSLAQALSSGDVYAAANAAMEMQNQNAQYSQESARAALELSQENALKAVDDQILLQKNARKVIEEEIKILQDEQRVIADRMFDQSLKMQTKQEEMKVQQDLINATYEIQENTLKRLNLELDQALKTWKDIQAVAGQNPTATPTATPAAAPAGASASPYGTVQPIIYPEGGATNSSGNLLDIYGNEIWGGGTFNAGGKVMKYATGGSVVPGNGSRDSVSAMLTPGEFVMRKAAVNKVGLSNLTSMNMGEMPRFTVPKSSKAYDVKNINASSMESNSVYNYGISVNVAGTNASPDEIANKVMMKIKGIESASIRRVNGY